MYHKTEQEIVKNWKGDNKTPMVSVCCTAYNHEPYIAEAIDSFLMQETDFPFEILIRDDCSTDRTASIVKDYADKYPNLIKPIFEKENTFSKGVQPMPQLYKIAQGKYIALCEGDDYWTNEKKLQKQFIILEKNKKYMISTHLTNNVHLDSALWKSEYTLDDVVRNFSPCHTSSYFFRNIFLFIDIGLLPKYMHFAFNGDYVLACFLTGLGRMHVHKECMSVYRNNKEGVFARHANKQGEIYKAKHILSIRDSIRFYFGYGNLMYLSKKNLRLELGLSRALFLNGEVIASFRGLVRAMVRLIAIFGLFFTYSARPPSLWK
jgi:glycosyltransferase involved in cell wall biosynthesis